MGTTTTTSLVFAFWKRGYAGCAIHLTEPQCKMVAKEFEVEYDGAVKKDNFPGKCYVDHSQKWMRLAFNQAPGAANAKGQSACHETNPPPPPFYEYGPKKVDGCIHHLTSQECKKAAEFEH